MTYGGTAVSGTKAFDFRAHVPETVLILRPDNLGDVVLFSGALRHLKAHWPTSRITLCVKHFVANYLELCPYVDEILDWEKVGGFLYHPYYRYKMLCLSRRSAGWRFGRIIDAFLARSVNNSLSFDMLLNPLRAPFWDYHLFARAVAVNQRIGISGDLLNQTEAQDRAAELIYNARMNVPLARKWDLELDINLEFLRFLGIDVTAADMWPEFWTSSSDRAWARQQLQVAENRDCLLLAIAPGTNGVKIREYPSEKIVETIQRVQGTKLSCVILGSAREIDMSKEIENSLMRSTRITSIVNLAGKTTVRQMIECLNVCDVVLSVESAPLHIATALRKPSVGIVGGGHYGRYYPWGDPDINRVANQQLDCYFCNWSCPRPTAACVKDISPVIVAQELQHLVNHLKRASFTS